MAKDKGIIRRAVSQVAGYKEREYGLTEREAERLQDEITRQIQMSGGMVIRLIKMRGIKKTLTKERRKEKETLKKIAKGRTGGGEVARKLGMSGVGRLLDRLAGTADSGAEAKKRRDAQKKLDKMEGVESGGGFQHGNTERVIHGIAHDVRHLSGKISNIQTAVSGTLVATMQGMNSLSDAVLDVALDVNDIRTAIMPRDIMAKGRKGSESEGQLQAVRFNPLAPVGEQFRQVSEKGNTTGARMGADFKTSAVMQAAVAASKLVRKEEKEEEQRGKLREKYKFKDIKERGVFVTDPINILREDMNENFRKVFDMLRGISSGGGLFDGIADLIPDGVPIPIPGRRGAPAPAPTGRGKPKPKPSVTPKGLGGAAMFLGRAGLVGAAGYAGWLVGSEIWKKIEDTDFGIMVSDIIGKSVDTITGKERRKRFAEERAEVERKQREGELPMPGNSQSTFDYLSPQADQALANLRLARESADISPEQRTAMDRQISQWEANRDEARARKEYESQYVNTGRIQRVESEADYKARLRALGDIIGQKESGGDYNAYNKGTVGDKMIGADVPIDLSKMTIAEYLRRSELPSSDPSRLFAVGKYQIIPKTMREAVSSLKLNPNTTHLTPRVQDGIFEEYLIGKKRGSIERYLRTGEGREAAELELSKEWAAFGVSQDMRGHKGDIKAGQSYYAGEGGNKASMLASDALDSSVSVTPVARGAALDNDSRIVRNAQAQPSGDAGGTTVVPIAMNKTQPIAMPGGRPMMRASPFNRDGSYLAMAHQDSWHPAG